MNRRQQLLPATLFLLPNLIGFAVFAGFPVVFSVAMSFTDWDLSLHNRFRDEPLRWVGVRNFVALFTHPDFWKYFGNTLFLMMTIPVGIAGSLALALLLSKPLRVERPRARGIVAAVTAVCFLGLGFALWSSGYGGFSFAICALAGAAVLLGVTTGSAVYRTLFYLPSFTSGVAIFLLWKQMYNPLHGPINAALQPTLDWLGGVVNASSPALWTTLGYALWAVAAAGLIGVGTIVVRNWIRDDFGLGTALMGLASLVVAALILYGLGAVTISLPARAAAGLAAPNWLNDMHWAKPAIMIMGLWAAVGSNNMLLYIAALSNIAPELYEAADIDGASGWKRFWHVTWPQLAPTTFFIVVLSVIGGLQGGFEQARAMTNGGPYGATTTLSYFIYIEGFETGRLGYASAVAWAMFVLIFVLTVFNNRFGKRYVEE